MVSLVNPGCFFISNNSISSTGMSGGDRIFIELARQWSKKVNLSIVGTEETISICQKEGLDRIDFFKTSNKLGFQNASTLRALCLNFFKKLINGSVFVIKNRKLFEAGAYIYSASDFYPDSIPAFLIKLMNPKVTWIAGFYLFAPAPWCADSPYKGKDLLRGFLYCLSQRPVYWLVNRYADVVFVTSEPDIKKFANKKRSTTRVFAVRGGVDIKAATEYLASGRVILVKERKYDSCFVGRFHQQKGVLVLMDIWRKVVDTKPEALLAMIGNGPLEKDVVAKARRLGIEKNINFFGFLDGEKKFEVFKQSKIVLHPATFDSGGMAAAGAMAWRLPGVSFDLESLKTYYPRGMVKVPLGDLDGFAKEILRLLDDFNYYENLAAQARNLAIEEWDWDKRAEFIYNKVYVNQNT